MIAALFLGVATGATFGPVNVEVTKTRLAGRHGDAVPLAVGSWLGDVGLMIAGSAMAVSVDGGISGVWLRAAAAVAVACIALASLRSGPALPGHPTSIASSRIKVVSRGAALSLLSPVGFALWGGVATAAVAHASGLGAVGAAAAVLLGDALWFALWLALLGALRPRLDRGAIRGIHVAANCGLLLLALALLIT